MACHDSDGGILACLPSVIPPSPFVPRILLSKMRGVLQGPRALFSNARGASEGCFPRAYWYNASGALPRRRESIPPLASHRKADRTSVKRLAHIVHHVRWKGYCGVLNNQAACVQRIFGTKQSS